jgi:Ca-activated chloride channel family protein
MRRRTLGVIGIVLVVVLAGCSGASNSGSFSGGGDGGGGAAGGAADGESIGLSAGGAQDANAFRRNVEEGYVPRPRAITHAGLYHDYYFDTGQQRACEAMFCPSYARAVTADPLSNETERYMTVGLNSGLTQSDFERPDLNVVVVIDTSGSMESQFDQYYYDGGERRTVEENQQKMDAAADAVDTMTRHLREGDEVGVVAFDNQARVVQEMQAVGEGDLSDLRQRVHSLRAEGGTNLDDGMETAREMARRNTEEGEETRIIYVTDAMPNIGETSEGGLRGQLERDASEGIHTTFIGVGVDFNTELVDAFSGVRGANYYTVNSPAEFEARMGEGFDYMVTPLVYDLSLSVDSEEYRIENVYGAPGGADTSELMEVTTLFPSRREANQTEGGVILLELERTAESSDPATMTLSASYETRDGQERETSREITFQGRDEGYYETTGVRKAVALTRYANLMQNWMHYEHELATGNQPEMPDEGVERAEPGQWEQGSVDLRVTEPYGQRIDRFRTYFAGEVEALGDDAMQQELDVLDRLAEQPVQTRTDDAVAEESDEETVTPQPRRDDVRGQSASTGALVLPDASVLNLASLVATVAIGLYGVTKRNRGL